MFKFSINVLAARERQVPQAAECCCGGHDGNISVLDTPHKALYIWELLKSKSNTSLHKRILLATIDWHNQPFLPSCPGVAIQLWRCIEYFADSVQLVYCHLTLSLKQSLQCYSDTIWGKIKKSYRRNCEQNLSLKTTRHNLNYSIVRLWCFMKL